MALERGMRASRGALRWFVLALTVSLTSSADAVQSGDSEDRSEQVQNDWSELDDDARQRVRRNYERWTQLSDDERALLRNRHRRLVELREKVNRDLAPEEQRELREMTPRERRSELGRRARERLHRRADLLPEPARRQLQGMPREGRVDRGEQFREALTDGLVRRLENRLRSRIRSGAVPELEGRRIRQILRSTEPNDRFRRLLRLLERYPQAFDIHPGLADRLRAAPTPADALAEFESFRRRNQRGNQRGEGATNDREQPGRDRLVRWLVNQGVPRPGVREALAAPNLPRLRAVLRRYELEVPPFVRPDFFERREQRR